MKKIFSSEAAYGLGLLILAIGTAFMERADFGMSMVVAPAYLLHVKLSEYFPFFTFGMAEYTLQLLLLIALALILRRGKVAYLFSFGTAVLYGFTLDGCMVLAALLPAHMVWRVVYYIVGMLLCAIGVALFFHTDLPPEAYELFVKELAVRFGWPIGRVKTVYDCVSCAVAVVLSFAFFGMWHFEGVKWGTVVCALINGSMIGGISAWMERVFEFRAALPRRKGD